MLEFPKGLPQPCDMTKAEIVDLLLREEYGYLPAAPLSMEAELVETDKNFCAKRVSLQTYRLHCRLAEGEFSFPIRVAIPLLKGEHLPCFIHINFRPDVPDRYQPTEEIADAGYAVASFCYNDVTMDDGDFSSGLAGVVYPVGRTAPDQCGKIGLWAWAAMRVRDFVATLPQIDQSRVAVVGHSRLGKTALLTGALDERFCCAFSNDSGCSGAALSRENTGETVAKIYDRFPYWFCENYEKYKDNEGALPFDQHYLLSANLPHAVYVASAEDDLWADPKNEYLSCVAADAYFRAHGKRGFVHPDRIAVANDVFHEGDIGYHQRTGAHYLSREDWHYYIQYLNKHFS